jgi:hypothetical protein
MRTLRLFMATAVSVLGVAGAANAASITVTSDSSTYSVSDTITLTIIGDSMGVFDNAVLATLLYNEALVTEAAFGSQTQFTTAGFLPWTVATIPCGVIPGGCTVVNQLLGPSPGPVDQLLTATLTLHATALGTVNVTFDSSGGPNTLDFFGITSAGGTSFTIVPEPTTAALLGLGIAGLTIAGRRRKS